MFVVTVTYRVRSDAAEQFLELVRENARQSVEREPGCRQFDVAVAGDPPTEVFLYETYDDEEAFEAHRSTPHFLEFDEAARYLVNEKIVRSYHLAQGGPA